MKGKKLAALFSAAALALGCCFATACNGEQPTATAGTTVTNAEWQAAFASLKTQDKFGVEITYTGNETTDYAPKSVSAYQDGYTLYYEFCYVNSAKDRETYMTFDETTLTATQYYRVEGTENWAKETRAMSSVAAYETLLNSTGVTYFLGLDGDFRASIDGEDQSLSELYSHFAYGQGGATYSAIVYAPTGSMAGGGEVYAPYRMQFSFDSGALQQVVTTELSDDGEKGTATMRLAYGVSTTVPQEIIDATTPDGGEAKEYTRVNANGEADATGKFVRFGTYPQSKVTDEGTISALTALAGALPSPNSDWISYKYYQNSSVNPDYTWYQDIEYEGEEYRGVYFVSYRPNYTHNALGTVGGYQLTNGYEVRVVYWFKYEPILWEIVEETTEGESSYATLLCELLIDCQDFRYTTDSQTVNGSTAYANNYEHSSIRAWLTDTFYNLAFSQSQQAIMQETTVANDAASTGTNDNLYVCNDTTDKVWLLSYADTTNYLKTSTERKKQATDYAQAQGLWKSDATEYLNNCIWWTRSGRSKSNLVATINEKGGWTDYKVNQTCFGVCPTIKLAL